MSRNVFFFLFPLWFVSQSGCKSNNFFLTDKTILKFFRKIFFRFLLFLLLSLSRNITRFAGCKNKPRFRIPQAFPNLFWKYFFRLDFISLPGFLWTSRRCGCKSSPFIPFGNDFLKVFLIYFLKCWFVGLYRMPFLKFPILTPALYSLFEILLMFWGFSWF